MHRNDLLNELHAYALRHPEEQAVTERFTVFVAEHTDCFERSLSIGHVTGSAWVVNRAGTHTLLTHHRKLNRWLQPGGHADGHPHPMDVALREVWEETGLKDVECVSREIFDLDIHTIPQRGSEATHDHYDVRFAVRAAGSEAFTVSEESHALCWVPIAQLMEKSGEESMLRMQRKWLNRQAPPLQAL